MSITTPRRRTISSYGTLLRNWSLGTRNGERGAAAVCNLGEGVTGRGCPTSTVMVAGAFLRTSRSYACRDVGGQGFSWYWEYCELNVLLCSALKSEVLSEMLRLVKALSLSCAVPIRTSSHLPVSSVIFRIRACCTEIHCIHAFKCELVRICCAFLITLRFKILGFIN